eukprot:4591891-Pyramimonas_sp.AAC.1
MIKIRTRLAVEVGGLLVEDFGVEEGALQLLLVADRHRPLGFDVQNLGAEVRHVQRERVVPVRLVGPPVGVEAGR